VGPHRDEIAISLKGRPLKGSGSSGEIWSAILALALASAEHLGRRLGILPVLLLDDVLTVLDIRRRGRLLRVLAGLPQAMLTTTRLPDGLEGTAEVFEVSGHRLLRRGEPAPDGGGEGETEWESDRGLLARC
jgi:DNA replication and repair protein RecF